MNTYMTELASLKILKIFKFKLAIKMTSTIFITWKKVNKSTLNTRFWLSRRLLEKYRERLMIILYTACQYKMW